MYKNGTKIAALAAVTLLLDRGTAVFATTTEIASPAPSHGESTTTGSINKIDIFRDVIVDRKNSGFTKPDIANKSAINSANTSGIGVELGGKLDMQYGYNSTSDCFKSIAAMQNCGVDTSGITKEVGNVNGLGTDTRLSFNVFKRADDLTTFGAYLEIQADRSSNHPGRQSYVYINSKVGRFEAGNMDGPSTSMQVSASNIARGTGGIDGDLRGWNNYKALVTGATFDPAADKMFIGKPRLPFNSVEKKQNRISYYTPALYGLTLGVSYTPNPGEKEAYLGGIDSVLSTNHTYKDLLDVGAKYSRTLFTDVGFTTSVIGQFGSYNKKSSNNPAEELHNIAAYEVGARVDVKKFSVAGSYSGQGKSGTLVANTQKKSGSYYTLGGAYKYNDDLAVSLTYFASSATGTLAQSKIIPSGNDGKSKVQIVSLGGEYLLIDGMKYYAELNKFKYDSDVTDGATKVIGSDGYTVLTGLRVQF